MNNASCQLAKSERVHYSLLQVLQNTSTSGMHPRQTDAFFTPIGFAMGGMWRKYKTRKGNSVSRLVAVLNVLPTPLQNGSSVSTRSKTMAKPSFALSHLNEIHTTLERLRGADCERLKLINLDGLLDQFAAVRADLEKLHDINSEMATTSSAFGLLLALLDAAEEKPLPAHGLFALVQPLCQRHEATWDALSNML